MPIFNASWRIEALDEKEKVAIIDLEGFIDTATSTQFKEEIENIIKRNIFNIIANFAKVTYLSSTGLGVLIEFMSALKKNQGNLVILKCSDKIRKILSISGLENIIKNFPDEEMAKEDFINRKKLLSEEKTPQKTIQFPFKKECPSCKQPSWIPRADILRCPKCEQIFYINNQGTITILKKPDKSQVEINKYKFGLRLPSDINYLNHVRIFITGLLREEKIEESTVNSIELAVDEALSNIVEHAYKFEKQHTIDMSFYVIPDSCFVINIKDKGKSIDPIVNNIKNGIEGDSVPINRERGRGFYIINKIMDKIEYQSIAGFGNELTMVKRFKKQPELTSTKNEEAEFLKNE